MMKQLSLIFVLLALAEGGKVLFYMPIIPKSSKITWYPLARKLAELGHQVTIVSPYGSDKAYQNLEEIVLSENYLDGIANNISSEILRSNRSQWEYFKTMFSFRNMSTDMTHYTMNYLKETKFFQRKYDITVAMAVASEASYYVAWKVNSTLALYFAQQGSLYSQNWAMGQSNNPAIYPWIGMTFHHPMTFLERLLNTAVTSLYALYRDYVTLPDVEAIIDEYFPEDSGHRPSLSDLERQAGLAFHFGHPLLMDGLRPVSPNYIMIGMMNCRPAQKLPQDIKSFMDASGDDGVILVSFGTVLRASMMSEEMLSTLTNVFRQLKQRVLWKWESEDMADKPDNVMLSKWLPQQDILAHPKLRLFITHGGQSSTQEALCHKKPVVVVPVFGDQPSNAIEAERRGYGLNIPISSVTTENLLEAVNQILADPKFTQKAQDYGNMVTDQMTRPLERAVWWIEYAMRYPGMQHMRSPVHDLHWTQYFLLDVIAFIVGIVIFLSYIIWSCCKCCCRTKIKSD